ncbi:MAG TPA: hypothetical protein VJG32_11275 [Anaerolineae bacterium]|nr:hypothetical protein [Anaerolineae bacterium]
MPANTTLTNTVLVDVLPDNSPNTEANFTYVNGSSVGPTPGPGTPDIADFPPVVASGHTLTWTLGALANPTAAAYVYTFTYRANVPNGDNRVEVGTNSATLVYDGGSVSASTNVTVARGYPGPAQWGYSPSDTSTGDNAINALRAGDVVTFSLFVTNAVDASTAYDLVVSDTLPGWLVYGGPAGSTPPPDSVIGVAGATQVGWRAASIGGSLTQLNALAPGAAITPLVFTATVTTTVGAGRQDNAQLRVIWRDLPADEPPQSRNATDVTLRSMNVSVSKSEVDGIDPQGRVVINEPITYTIVVTIPAGTSVYSPAYVLDTLNDGLNYGGEVLHSDQTLDAQAGPSGNNTWITWTLMSSIVASNDVTLTFVFTAYSDGTLFSRQINRGESLNNSVYLRYNHGVAQINSPSGNANVTFVRPDISPNKDSTPSAVISVGGETIQYRITNLRNGSGTGDASAATAYDVLVTDTLPVGFSLVEAVPPPDGVFTLGSSVVLTWGVAPSLPVGYFYNPPGITTTNVTFYVTATAPLAFTGGRYYTNTVDVQYSDQPGDAPGEQTYVISRTKTLDVNFVETKAVTPTSPLRSGDVVTYTLADFAPAGAIMYWPRHQDDLPQGMRFITGSMTLQGATFVSSPIPITLTQGTQERLLWWTDTISNVYGSETLVVTATFNARFTGINTQGGAVYSNTNDFRGAPSFNNSARVDWSTQDISDTLDVFELSNNAGSTVVQPFLADSPFGKYFGGSTSGSTTVGAGDVVTYHLVITNTGRGPAHDVVLSDTLPAGLQLDTFTVTGRAFAGAAFTPTLLSVPLPGATGAIGWLVDTIPAGDGNTSLPSTVLTVTYSALVTNDIGAGATLPNQAFLADYSSLPGSDPFERSYTFLLTRTQAITLNTPMPLISKSVNVTTANWFDVVTYTLAFPQPPVNATLYNVTVSDTLPAGLTVLAVEGAGGAGAQVGFSGSLVTATATSVAPLAQMLITITAAVEAGATGTQVNTATLEWDDAAAAGTRHSATSNPVSTTILLPELGIAKNAPVTAVPGRMFTYTIGYSNTGTSNAANVQIEDDLPDEVSFVDYSASGALTLIGQPDPLRWDAGSVGPGQGGSIVITVSLPSATALGTILTNTASISTTTPGDSISNNQFPVTTFVAASRLEIGKLVSPDPAEAGQPILYTLTVTNTGNAATSGLIVTDALPLNTAFGSAGAGGVESGGQVRWMLAPLAPAASTVVTFSAVVASPLVSGTLITNDAYGAVAANSVDSASGAPVSVIAHSRPRLTISKAGPATIGLGASVRYTVVVTNSGTTDAQNTTLTDDLPDLLPLASFSASGPVTQTAGPDPLGLDLGALAPGQTRSVWITVTSPLTLTPNSVLTNTATVATSSPGENGADNTAQHVAAVSGVVFGIRKTANVSSVAPAGTIVYTIEYSNTGTAPASGVVVTETYDANVTFVAANPAPNVGNNVWNTPGTLNAGERRTIVVTVTVANALPNGTPLTNVARISASGALPQQATHIANVISAAVLTLDKTGNGATMPGYTITYRLNYANVGNAPATSVRLTETYPAGLTFVAASPSPSFGNNVWDLGALTPPGNGTIVVTLTVGSGLPFGTAFTNTVVLDSEQTAPVADSFRTTVGPLFLPLVMKNFFAAPNLAVQNIVVTPASPAAQQATVISVTIVNSGTATANAGFWVDLYVDPAGVPQPGQPWNELAPTGKAWVLRTPLAPGQSITLDTRMPDDPNNPAAVYSNWPGWFDAAGPHTLYAQVDAFGSANGLVVELSESDNLFGPLGVTVTASGSTLTSENVLDPPVLDPRPTTEP